MNRDRFGYQRRLVAVEILDESSDAAFVEQVDFLRLFMPRVAQDDMHAAVEESELAVAVLELLEVELRDLEGRGRREEGDFRALLEAGLVVRWRGIADYLQRLDRIAEFEAHVVLLAVAPDIELQPFGQGVDHRDTDAVEAAGDLVGIVVRGVLELAAGVQLGHDDLGRRDAFFGVHAGRDAAAIVLDRDAAVGIERDQDQVAMTGERLVDRVIRYLEHHMMQAAAVVGVSDIHTGPLSDGIQAFENLDRIGAIFVLVGRTGSIFRHVIFIAVGHPVTIAAGAAKPK